MLAPELAQVCQRLDGIPLAIELAAVRVKAISVEQLAERIDDRFLLLTGGSRTALPRHQTLRALIDWSYDLLSPAERTLLNRLSVFVGGWALKAAESVCSDTQALPIGDVLDVLTHLVDKSLVIAEEVSGEAHYRMLETIRQYARDKLLDSGEAERLHGQHLGYYLAFAQGMDEKLHGPDEIAALKQLEHELDNFRAALDWSLGEGRVEMGLRLAGLLREFWLINGYFQEGLARVQSMLAHPEAANRNLARAIGLFVAADLSDDIQASRGYLEELLPLVRELGDPGQQLLVLGLGSLSSILFTDDPASAAAMLDEGIYLACTLNHSWPRARLLSTQGWFYLGKRDLSAARQAFERSIHLSQSARDRRMAALAKRGSGVIPFYQDDYAAAIQQFEEVLEFFREINDRQNISNTLTMLAEIERANGRYDVAKKYCLESREISRELGVQDINAAWQLGAIAIHDGDPEAKAYIAEALNLAQERHDKVSMAYTLFDYASMMAMEKKSRQAVILLAFYDAFFEAGDRRSFTPTDQMDYENYLTVARKQLDEATFQSAWEEGKAMTLEQALELAQE